MVDAFSAARVPLFVAYYRRRLSRFLLGKELVETGAIGRITSVTYRQSAPYHRKPASWRVDVTSAGGGYFLDLGSHTLDLLDFFFGPLLDVSGSAANCGSSYAAEDSVVMTFKTPAGALGSASWNFAARSEVDQLTLCGTDGQIELPIFASGPVLITDGEGTREISHEHPPHVQQPLIQSVVDDLLGRGSCPSTGESAWRTSQVMDDVLARYYGGRDDAFWERPATWPGRLQRET
jgi:predicted dehydrogenase